jgi:hypothetical protein
VLARDLSRALEPPALAGAGADKGPPWTPPRSQLYGREFPSPPVRRFVVADENFLQMRHSPDSQVRENFPMC